jgi:hypothetical protein
MMSEPPAEALMACPTPQEPVEKSPEFKEFCDQPIFGKKIACKK